MAQATNAPMPRRHPPYGYFSLLMDDDWSHDPRTLKDFFGDTRLIPMHGPLTQQQVQWNFHGGETVITMMRAGVEWSVIQDLLLKHSFGRHNIVNR